MIRRVYVGCVLLVVSLAACGDDGPTPRTDGGRRDAASPFVDGGFVCQDVESEACLNNTHYSCEPDGEFLRSVQEDCAAQNKVCVDQLWCVVCRPDEVGCFQNNAARCRPDGSGWEVTDECDVRGGEVCRDGMCRNLCQIAVDERSYQGCEFYSADLDNFAQPVGGDAASQQYAVVVSNTGNIPTEVVLERNDAPVGQPPVVVQVASATVLPGDLEVFELDRREVDGSSETGVNDGTHTAITSNAYRIRSVVPIIAYQFNPLDNVGVFSNDASLLLPTSAVDTTYTVGSWPQTIANSSLPSQDFDPDRMDEDSRAFLTIIGTQPETHVRILLGNQVVRVMPFPPLIPQMSNGDMVELDIGPFDVINLETGGFNADFTGSKIEADKPIIVFTGSEASDAPRFDDLANRQCCADHLEEQLFPDSTLGRTFVIARTPQRGPMLNAAFLDPRDHVPEANVPEYVRVVATRPGLTTINTTLPPPNDTFQLDERQDRILTAFQDFLLEADQAIVVVQVAASQGVTGLRPEYPGGDPALIAVAPVEQWRSDYVFLTPDKYAFDSLIISANATTTIYLDEEPLPPTCTVSPADGIPRGPGDPPPDRVIYQCQLSFPDVQKIGPANYSVLDGDQNDGVHTIQASEPVGLVVWGFDAYVSYAYSAGLNLDRIE